MIKVRVYPLSAGVAGVSTLLALSHTACTAEPIAADESEGLDEEALSSAGKATFDLSRVYWDPSRPQFRWTTQVSVDEFVRVGTRVTVRMPMYLAWEALHPEGGSMPEVDGLKKYDVRMKAVFLDKGKVLGSRSLGRASQFAGEYNYDLTGEFSTFTVPKRTDSIAFELSVTEPGTNAFAKLPTTAFVEVPVFGGELPNKTALFDNPDGTFRQRVIEGGDLLAGSTMRLVYTDWRADQLVDKMSHNRQIGVAQGAGRFGVYDMAIFGDLSYEVSCGYAVDDAAWQEVALTANSDARTLYGQYGRTAYETDIVIPKGAKKVSTYCHVKAYLVVDYSKYGTIKQRWYEDGARILVAERWDNVGGSTHANYELSVGTK